MIADTEKGMLQNAPTIADETKTIFSETGKHGSSLYSHRSRVLL
ncbi:MAG: hypothetical protein SOX46_03015 [Clostridiaceae bacterium]|nr:hypothetical protein [Clostridiaceae bacterium]